MKKLLCLLTLIPVLTFSGCNQPRDINSLGFLVALGIDNNEYTLQFANPVAFAGSEGEFNKDSLKTLTINADSLNSAINTAQENLLKRVDTSYLKLVVFSDELKDGKIKDYLDVMSKSSRFHPDTYTAISKCTPKEFLQDVSDKLEMNPSKYYDNIFSGKYNQFSPKSTIKSANKAVLVMPVVDIGNNSDGIAVLSNGQIKYNLSNYSGQLYNILKGDLEVFNLSPMDGIVIKLDLPSKVTPEIKGNNVFYNFQLKGEITENIDKKNKEYISSLVKAKLEKDIKNLLDFNYKYKNEDILNIKDFYKKFYLTNKAYDGFYSTFQAKNVNFTININIDITRDGVILNEN